MHSFHLSKNLTINKNAIIMPSAKGNKGNLYPKTGLSLNGLMQK